MFANRIVTLSILLVSAVSIIAGCQPAPQKPNTPPFISGISGDSSSMPLTEMSFTCDASDQDGDKLNYTWTADNGTITGKGANITWLTPGTAGNYKLNVTVDDGRGATASYTKEIKVIFNADGSLPVETPVVLRLTLPSDQVVTDNSKHIRKWATAPIQCIVTNAEGRKLTYKWTAEHGRLYAKQGLKEGTASSVDWIAPELGGDYTVNVTVTDQDGNTASGAATIKVICCGNLE